MDCPAVKNLLIEFLEGELSGRDKSDIEEHLKDCLSCRQEQEMLSASWQMLGSYRAPKLKDDFTPSLMRRIHSEQSEIIKVKYTLPRFIFRQMVPVLASVVMGILIFSWFGKRPQDTQIVKIKPQKTVQVAAKVADKIGNDKIMISDKEIIQNLDVLENLDFLENINLAKELDTIENSPEESS